MTSVEADITRSDVQETQFTSSSIVNTVLNDETTTYSDQADIESSQLVMQNGDVHLVRNDYGTTITPKPPNEDVVKPKGSVRAQAPDLLRGLVMVLMAIDHAAVTSSAYPHGQAIIGEKASTRVTRWNHPVGYIARLLTHTCAPGFFFLMGMGIVYFGRSRSKLGWSAMQMIRHFVVRAIVLFIVNQFIGLFILGKFFPILNIVILALGFNYVVIGTFWVFITWTEAQLSRLIVRLSQETSRPGETEHLLPSESEARSLQPIKQKADKISFYIHNVLIFVLATITIWWNIWLDPYHGRCPDPASTQPTPQPGNVWYELLFHMVQNPYIFSGFPPLAWLSPVLLGVLYARIVLSRPWKPITINLANLAVGATFAILFVLTRVLRFGNLDEDCYAMPEHLANPGKNQYLASPASFFYITKYPASPSFMFFALACDFTALGLFGFAPPKAVTRIPLSILLIFGTSSLFFFALHLPLYVFLGSAAKALFGHKMDFDDMQRPGQKAWGIGAGIVFWTDYALGLLILWPLCKWYGKFKATKDVNSIWRFF